MIHQLIFAAPKPELSEEEFHRYWVDVHAVKYAAKIPQIRKYLVDTRVPLPGDDSEPLWHGVAEIWLANEQEQLDSLRSDEFLYGARLDEPNWAAFWRTVVLDTDATEIVPGPPQRRDTGDQVKLIVLVKRREGLSLADFRARGLGAHADLVREVPGLRRYLQCHTRDGAYGVGEAVLDAAYQLWFDDVDALASALESAEFAKAEADLLQFTQARYVHRMAMRENWIIGPDPR
jgi:uncharacterized protein (TIGR02118 family)